MTTTDQACAVTGALTGLVAALLVGSVGVLYLDNTYGPLDEHPTLGTPAALAAALLTGGLVFLLVLPALPARRLRRQRGDLLHRLGEADLRRLTGGHCRRPWLGSDP